MRRPPSLPGSSERGGHICFDQSSGRSGCSAPTAVPGTLQHPLTPRRTLATLLRGCEASAQRRWPGNRDADADGRCGGRFPRARAVFWGRSTSVVASASSPGKRRLAKAEPLGQGRPASRSQSQDWNPGSFDLRRDASVSLSCGGLAPGARERSERRARPCPLDTSSRTAPGGSWNPQPFFLFYFLLPFLFFFFFFLVGCI